MVLRGNSKKICLLIYPKFYDVTMHSAVWQWYFRKPNYKVDVRKCEIFNVIFCHMLLLNNNTFNIIPYRF